MGMQCLGEVLATADLDHGLTAPLRRSSVSNMIPLLSVSIITLYKNRVSSSGVTEDTGAYPVTRDSFILFP